MDSGNLLSKVIFYLMFIPVNLLLFFVIFDAEILLYSALGFLLLIVLIYLKFRKKGISSKYHFPQVKIKKRDIGRLVFRYLRINRNFILGSGVGLFLATGIITQSVIVSSSYQQYAFDDYLSGSDVSAYTYSFKWINNESVLQWNSKDFPTLTTTVENNGIGVTGSISYGMVEYSMILGEVINLNARYLNTHHIKTRQWSIESYDMLKQLPTFPDIDFNESQSLLVVPDKLYFPAPEFGTITRNPSDSMVANGTGFSYQVVLDKTFKKGADIANTSVPFNNMSLTVDNLWEWTTEDMVYIRSHNLNIPIDILQGTQFIPKNEEWDIYNKLEARQTIVPGIAHIWGILWMEGSIWVDIPLLSHVNPKDFELLLSETFDTLYSMTVSFINTAKQFDQNRITGIAYSPLNNLLQKYLEYNDNLQRIMISFSAPLILISLFFYFFAISITQKRKIEIFYKMKIRGASNKVFTIIMISEMLAYGILASVVGLFGGFISSVFSMGFVGALVGVKTTIPVITPFYIYWKLPVVGILLALMFNLNGMFESSLISFQSVSNLEKESTSVVSNSNLDLYTFSFALAYWIIVPFLHIPAFLMETVYQQLGFLAVVATILSLPFMSNRFFFPLLRKNSRRLPDDMVYLSITGVLHYRKYTTKFFALLLITLFFAFQGMISTSTIVEMNTEMTEYSIGSDLYVQGLRSWDQQKFNKVMVDGVQSASPISELSYSANSVERLPGQSAGSVISYHFMGIDKNTFPSTANWRDSYASQSLNKTVSKFEKDSYNIAIQEDDLRILGLNIGDSLWVRYGYRSQQTVHMNITSTFKYFPRLVTKDISDITHKVDLRDVYIVADLQDMELYSDFFSRTLQYGALVKTAPGADLGQISDDIYRQYLSETYLIQSSLNYRGSFFSQSKEKLSPLVQYEELFIYSSLSTMLFVSLLLGILGTVYYSYVVLKTRKHEMGIYRALGMVRNQMMRLMVIEILILFFSALLLSFITAAFLIRPIFNILAGTAVSTTPPLRVVVPWLQIGLFTGFEVIITVLLSFLPAIYVSRQSTASIMEGI